MNSVESRRDIADDAYDCDDYRLAFRLYHRLAMEGDAHAMWRLGVMHRYGFGVTANRAIGALWIRAAAERSNMSALYDWGCICRDGEVGPVDMPAAVAAFRRAAQLGAKRAQLELGIRYELGQGVAANPQRAAHWYRLAAMQWSEEATGRMMGLLYAQATARS